MKETPGKKWCTSSFQYKCINKMSSRDLETPHTHFMHITYKWDLTKLDKGVHFLTPPFATWPTKVQSPGMLGALDRQKKNKGVGGMLHNSCLFLKKVSLNMTILMGSNKLNLCFEKIPFCFSHWTFDTLVFSPNFNCQTSILQGL